MSRDRQAGSMESRPSAVISDHLSVMCNEVVEFFVPAAGGLIVDCTLGSGGHAEALLSELDPPVSVIGLDKDGEALRRAEARLARFGSRATLRHRDFDELSMVLNEERQSSVAGILYDLGVSSPQIDVPERGFSYQREGPLDMRMNQGSKEPSASGVVNEYTESELASVISRYGDERFAGRIAEAIVRARPLTTTTELARVVTTAIPAARRRTGRHPARRTFQAIRIEVNREIEKLENSLGQALEVLAAPGGRLVAISYHSLEDRVVKRFIAGSARGCTCPPRLAACACGRGPLMRPVTRKPARPSSDEVRVNRRAASARLRCAERTAVPSPGGERDG